MTSSKIKKKSSFVSKYCIYLLVTSVILIIYGSVSLQNEFLTLGLMISVGLVLSLKEEIKKLQFSDLENKLDIENLERKLKDPEINITQEGNLNEKLFNEYDPKQTESAQ